MRSRWRSKTDSTIRPPTVSAIWVQKALRSLLTTTGAEAVVVVAAVAVVVAAVEDVAVAAVATESSALAG